ncbi:MAG: hypothetical protein K2L88_03185 [Clostridiales bacterium]|nr:hypothetical protein [Clostridiales bacterium]
MKRTQSVKPIIGKSKILSLVAAAIIALMIVVVALVAGGGEPVAHAASGGSVTIHVYDSTQNYSKLASWVWFGKGAGTEYKISSAAAQDEPFFKEYSENGKTVKNVARTFKIDLTEEQVLGLKGGTQLGFLVCVSTGKSDTDFWKRYEKETADVLVDLSTVLDANNHADIYYVRKDNIAYTDLEEALATLEKITSARFTAKTATNVTLQFEVTTPLSKGLKAFLYNGNAELGTATVNVDSTNPCTGKVTFNTKFDFSINYTVMVEGVSTECVVSKTAFIDDADFIKTYEGADTQKLKYGCDYKPSATTFRVWAPFASSVVVKIFNNGSAEQHESAHFMSKRIPQGGEWGGVWELTREGDLNGKYYTYVVTNDDFDTETIDPYAKACGANGTRAMILDLDSTDPAGWDNDAKWRDRNAANKTAVDTPIIWEVTVNDFSSSADSGMKYKGKYLAFTENNTTVPGNKSLKTGVNYLKDLGITYVHLNPVYDFATVDEGDFTRADSGAFNWGYDPQNYNIPEGSYSTDPANGAVRINEFKRMVKALHDAGIGVIMDVVYNHTYSTSGQALHDTVPYYYHRTDVNGKFTNGSGCGNETASERTMVRKYIIDSMLYWAEEYHIDGFRFDLMGVHDNTTLTTIRNELDKIDKRILLYGEPWSADGCYVPQSFKNRIAASKSAAGITGYAVNPSTNMLVKNMFAGYNDEYPRDMTALPDRIAVFNDGGREGLRGNNDPGKGWANGSLGMVGKVAGMIEGGADGDHKSMNLGVGSRNVAYAAAHDNYTLWDQIRGVKQGVQSTLFYDEPVAEDIKRCKLVASAYMMSTGMCFMLAGEEMGRTKYGNHNSYNSPAKLNQIVWSRQADFSSLHSYFRDLIKLRKQYSTQLFSYSKSTSANFCWGNFGETGPDYTNGSFTFTRTKNGATLEMTLNASTRKGTVKIGGTTLSF